MGGSPYHRCSETGHRSRGPQESGRGLITLRREHSKNREPRELPLTQQLAELIERRWEARTITRDEETTLSPPVSRVRWKRYRIVNVEDMREALTRTEAATVAASTARTVVPLRAAKG
jgi:hypothetical protein